MEFLQAAVVLLGLLGWGSPRVVCIKLEVMLESLTHVYIYKPYVLNKQTNKQPYVLEKGYLALVGKHLGRSQAEAGDRLHSKDGKRYHCHWAKGIKSSHLDVECWDHSLLSSQARAWSSLLCVQIAC